MKKFNFSLEKVRSVKTTLFEKEKSELANKRHHLRLLEDKVNYLLNDLEKKNEAIRQKMQTGVRADEIQQFQFIKDSLEKQIERAKKDVENQRLVVEKQLAKVMEMDKEVKALDKLREKQLEEYKYQANKEQQEFILELFSNKISQNSSNSDKKLDI